MRKCTKGLRAYESLRRMDALPGELAGRAAPPFIGACSKGFDDCTRLDEFRAGSGAPAAAEAATGRRPNDGREDGVPPAASTLGFGFFTPGAAGEVRVKFLAQDW